MHSAHTRAVLYSHFPPSSHFDPSAVQSTLTTITADSVSSPLSSLPLPHFRRILFVAPLPRPPRSFLPAPTSLSTMSGKSSSSQSSSSSSGAQSHGHNSAGNHYCTRGDSAASGGAYHYSNTNGSYYYQNSNGSTYYNSGNGHSVYTPPSGNPRTGK